MTLCYQRGKNIPSCGFNGIIFVDSMVVVLAIEAIGAVELAVTVHAPLLLVDSSPLLLFLGVTIFLTYILIGFLIPFLVILPLLNLMHTYNMRSFLNKELKKYFFQK